LDTTATLLMPPARSTLAGDVDALFYFILFASLVIFIIVVAGILFFVARYRQRDDEGTTSPIAHNTKLEIVWSVIPLILVTIVFFWGFRLYMRMQIVPADALEIKATGQKWFWSFDYPNGHTSVNELVVPASRTVKLLMSSRDVIHSFYVPDFRIKMDVLPNRYTLTWFEAPEAGQHNLFCAEYCGKGHSEMIGRVRVLGEREYDEWLETAVAEGEEMSLAEYGEVLYRSKACFTCHSVDGSNIQGPSFLGSYGSRRGLQSGNQVTVDENYIRESILNPQAKVAAGFQPVMPTYQGLLKDRQIDALIEYIKTLSENN
jgi:cytochrome c oxidase subunit 2